MKGYVTQRRGRFYAVIYPCRRRSCCADQLSG